MPPLRLFPAVAALAALIPLTSAPATEPKPPKGFTALFNGKDLSGWHGWAIHKKGASPDDVAKLTPGT